jgi:uncharacterized membrane protein YfcA
MTILLFTLLVGVGSAIAGFLGALTGLGGGVVLVPLLTLVFGVDIHYAMGASLVSVIATSSGAASAFVREGYSNIRVGMFLEVATTLGALLGAFLTIRKLPEDHGLLPTDGLSERLRLSGSYPGPEGPRPYHVSNVPGGFALMFGAGTLSGLLGIGSGAMKVVAMDQVMKIPFKVSTTTSNFMIGVTAAASAGIYLKRGYIEPGLAMPVMLGVLAGSMFGAKILFRSKTHVLRLIFGAVIVFLGIQMIIHSLTGKL